MQNINKALQAGHAAFQRGAFADARRQLRGITHPKGLHLLGLVEKADGNFDTALALLRRAAAKDNRDPEIANNTAALARQMGQTELAEAEFRRALGIRPDMLQAALGLGQLLIDQERYEAAHTVYLNIAVKFSSDIYVQYGLATALLGLGESEKAEAIFDSLVDAGNRQPQILFMRGRCRLQLGKTTGALQDLNTSHSANPDILTFKALANTYWMQNDRPSFDALIESALAAPELAIAAVEVLRQSGDPAAALTALNTASANIDLPADSWSAAAAAYIDMNDGESAEKFSRESLTFLPDDPQGKRNMIVSLLMQGKADEAMPFIEGLREQDPNDQLWIAYEVTALRMLGSDRYASIVDIERFVRPYTLPVPDGFASLQDFNAAFLEYLKRWHGEQTHPLNQSLRLGSQTPRDLSTIDEPLLKAFYKALDEPIRQYMSDVGNGPDHPLTARNTGDYRIAGGWSVQLHGGGNHVNHVHTDGWISSSYYVAVPEETRSDSNKAGWIKFSEPPFETVPPCTPEKWIQPEAGMLVLFPSYLWHGTQPISDDAVRVTAPFDAVPV